MMRRLNLTLAPVALAFLLAPAVYAQSEPAAPTAGPVDPGAAGGRKKRQPPPALTPIAETSAAQKLYGNNEYEAAVAQAKTALTKNEKYTPAMLVMAKSYFRLRKYEWVRHLWKMMQANNATEAEKAEMFHLLAWMEVEKKNVPGSIEMLKKATEARPDNPIYWNNLGAQYLEVKNYREAAPALQKAVDLNAAFAKAYLNLGSAHRGLKDYEKAEAAYQKALQIFPNYADAVFHLGILYLDAEKIANMDTIAKLNTAIGHFARYKQMMGPSVPRTDPAETYVAEAQEKVVKEQKRIERQKKQEERDRQRAAQKAAEASAAAAAANPKPAAEGGTPPAGAAPAAPGAPAAAPEQGPPTPAPAPGGAAPSAPSGADPSGAPPAAPPQPEKPAGAQ